ncbi:MAG: hypothetical protein LBB65_09005 [Burkholderiales bacterium]|jgi:hypothetical protein|nr:hypothetical protein [Burkholderiales bacterium]
MKISPLTDKIGKVNTQKILATLAIRKTFSEITEKLFVLCQEQQGRGKQWRGARQGLAANVACKQQDRTRKL